MIAVAVTLLHVRWSDPFLNRCKNYLAAGYLIRLVISVFYITGMFVHCEVEMPFTSFAMMDIVILAVFLWESQERSSMKDERTPDS